MKSRAASRFWTAYSDLPRDVQEAARKAYRLFADDPRHPSLQFKKVHDREPVYSARVTVGYRALGLLEEYEVTWFWIGSHSDYERLIRNL